MLDPNLFEDNDNEHVIMHLWLWIFIIGGCSLIAWIAIEIYLRLMG